MRIDSAESIRKNLNEMNKMIHMIELGHLPKTYGQPQGSAFRSEITSRGETNNLPQTAGFSSGQDFNSVNSNDY